MRNLGWTSILNSSPGAFLTGGLMMGLVLSQLYRWFRRSSSITSTFKGSAPMPYLKSGNDQAQVPALARTRRTKQPYDCFLVLDVEATCLEATGFAWPNEIIEWPVCLMRWKDKTENGKASQLEVIDEFRSFVRPTWRPKLSAYCTKLTGITQEQVDDSTPFPAVLEACSQFLQRNGLIDSNGERLVRFCWCSDGPWDIRDFVVKQCFISKIAMPNWLQGDVLDVRMTVTQSLPKAPRSSKRSRRRPLNLTSQLSALQLAPFEGRQHSGIDDTRNIARLVTELARRGVLLLPNTAIKLDRRWPWMGKSGRILEEYLKS